MTTNRSRRKTADPTDRIFSETIRDYGMLQEGDRVLVALSGGKDSVCLLSLLCAHRKDFGISVAACHVHHGIRKSADRDEALCRKLCQENGVPYYLRRVNASDYARAHGLSLEHAARKLRYAALKEVAEKQNLSKIATAHTASDNTETVLLALIRGGGIKALSGIDPCRPDGVIRPLIRLTAGQTERFCKQNGVPFVRDETNRDLKIPRNFVRRAIVPRLKEQNPALDRTVLSMTATLNAQRRALEAAFLEYRRRLSIENADTGAPLSVLKPLAERRATHAFLYDLLSGFLSAAGCDEPLSGERFEAVRRLIGSGASDRRVEVGGGFSFFFDSAALFAGKDPALIPPEEARIVDRNALLERSVSVYFSGHEFCFSPSVSEKAENVYKFHTFCTLDRAKIFGNLCVRYALSDDRLCVGGRSRRVKDLLASRKYPPALRKAFPVIADEQGVLWVPGELCDDRVRSDGGEELTIRLISGGIYEILLQKRRQYE